MHLSRAKQLVSAIVVAGLLAACSAALFLDGADKKPPPPTHKVRRDLQREIDTLERELVEVRKALEVARSAQELGDEQAVSPAEEAKTWAEAARLLPKDYAGQPDWVQALAEGTITPRPGLDPATPEQAVFDLDVGFADAADNMYHQDYSHAVHTQWLTCKNCHPSIFPLERDRRSSRPVTLADIKAGKACGVCHGTVAFAADQACARCHKRLPSQSDWRPSEEPQTPIERARTWKEAARHLPVNNGMPDWARAVAEGVIAPRAGIDPDVVEQPLFPLDVELVPVEAPVFKAVFPHAAHTAVLTCASCHPVIFQMRAGADAITMEKIFAGEYCGRCHGKVAFDVPTGCPRCHEALVGPSEGGAQ